MPVFQAAVLGIIQGLTEFLPISSSGHLVLAHSFFGLNSGNDLFFDVMLHLATGLAVVLYFRKDILSIISSFFKKSNESDISLLSIIAGTIPAVLVGLFFQDIIETTFRNVKLVALALIVGSVLMYFADRYWSKLKEFSILTKKKGFIVGCFQALALIPGISRSGSTISGSLFSGLKREDAIRFSFILSAPIIFGSALKELWSLRDNVSSMFNSGLVVGFVLAFVCGMAAIHFMISYLKNKTFKVFIWYRLILAALVLILL